MSNIKAVLFDLDGTLIDTAIDMAAALNQLLSEEGQAALDYNLIRSEVSHGARAMIVLAFDEPEDSERFEQLRQRFLDIYKNNIAVGTTLFDGMDGILSHLEERQIPWGIVTNKPSWLTLPLLNELNLSSRAATVICADTAGIAKPDPKPMLDACMEINIEPGSVMYVGDDERDVEAAHNAGMPCIAMRCGYIRQGQNPDNWGAEYVMDTAGELMQWLQQLDNAA